MDYGRRIDGGLVTSHSTQFRQFGARHLNDHNPVCLRQPPEHGNSVGSSDGTLLGNSDGFPEGFTEGSAEIRLGRLVVPSFVGIILTEGELVVVGRREGTALGSGESEGGLDGGLVATHCSQLRQFGARHLVDHRGVIIAQAGLQGLAVGSLEGTLLMEGKLLGTSDGVPEGLMEGSIENVLGELVAPSLLGVKVGEREGRLVGTSDGTWHSTQFLQFG